MSLGLTVGKFYPFHLGHDLLLRTAKAQVDRLVVLIGYKPTQQLPVDVRSAWIRELHPDVEVIDVLEDIPEAPEPCAQRALDLLAPRRPDLVFTSEDYGPVWAELMGARHVSVDVARGKFAVSGTQLRQDLTANWQFLSSPAKAYFARRVSVMGVESSGTTTLAEALARHFQTVWVPEYGRWYWEGRRYTPHQEVWESHEFLRIARGQAHWEADLARQANRLVICDTDPLATHVWHRRFMNRYCPELERFAAGHRYDLTILTAPDFAFVQDGTREGEAIRHQMHEWFREVLQAHDRRFIVVEGSYEHRLEVAVEQIKPLLSLPKLADP